MELRQMILPVGVLIVVSLFWGFAFAQTKATTQEFPVTAKVSTEWLNVRIFPKADNTSTIVQVLKFGDTVTVTGENGKWAKIKPPEGAWCWVYSRHIKVGKDNTGVATQDTALRTDSRITATKISVLKKGTEVKVLKEYLGWYKISAPEDVPFYVAKRYLQYLKPTTLPKTTKVAQKPTTLEDAKLKKQLEKFSKIKSLVDKQDKLLEEGKVDNISYLEIIVSLQELVLSDFKQIKTKALALQKACTTKQMALEKIRRGIEEAQNQALKDEIARIKQLLQKKTEKPRFDFVGIVDTTGKWLHHRPGTHKLIKGTTIICFLRAGNKNILRKLNRYYSRKVGVCGKVITSPEGWPGYKLVIVDRVTPIKE
jgi:uncharacterized protein YgiM (DUF1202 family)